jgi:hypothetical protein
MRSISSSMSCSVADGEFKSVYDMWGACIDPSAGEAAGEGGNNEKNDGAGTMHDRYWSRTY